MTSLRDDSNDQSEIWKGTGGRGWVSAQALLDEVLRPLEDLLVDAVSAAARSVLDVGCGTGGTTVAVARRIGAEGSCLGIDISEVMIEAARDRAERAGVSARFICADAQTYAFEPATVDMILSRFGVMFFGDPVQAFANLLRVARDGAGLCCLVWRGPAENPFMTVAERAAEPFLPGVSRRAPDEPGQFGLAEAARVREVLTRSGWRGIDVAPIDVPCAFPVSELNLYLTQLGPVGRALQRTDRATRERVIEAIRPAFDRYVEGNEVRFNAACWMVRARAGSNPWIG